MTEFTIIELRELLNHIIEGDFEVKQINQRDFAFYIYENPKTSLIRALDKIEITQGEFIESVSKKLEAIICYKDKMRIEGWGFDKAGHTLTSIARKLARIEGIGIELSPELKRGCDAKYTNI